MKALQKEFMKVAEAGIVWGFRAIILGPPLLAVFQCSAQNDHHPWERPAVETFTEDTALNYFWIYKQGRGAVSAVGSLLPASKDESAPAPGMPAPER